MVYKGDSMHKKWAFTLIEILIVVIIIGIMLTMIPFRMQSLRNHTQLSLISQQREDIRNRTLLRMRQWRVYDTATVTLTTQWVTIVYSGGVKWDNTEQEIFPEPVTLQPAASMQWTMKSYDIACSSSATGVQLSLAGMNVCYTIDQASCTMKRIQWCIQ